MQTNEIERLVLYMQRAKGIAFYMDFMQSGPKPGEKGWLLNYAAVCDELLSCGRYGWWMMALLKEELPESPIPKIQWVQNPGMSPAKKHLQDVVNKFSSRGYVRDALRYVVNEIAWGMGVYRAWDGSTDKPPKELFDGSRELFMKSFGVHFLYQYPYDYFGDMIAESKGGGKHNNPSAFFPTPHSLVELILQMTSGVSEKHWKRRACKTVCDPCVGTGRLLLHASDYHLPLYGGDIDPYVLQACRVNMALYVPWAQHVGGKLNTIREIRDSRGTEESGSVADADLSNAKQTMLF